MTYSETFCDEEIERDNYEHDKDAEEQEEARAERKYSDWKKRTTGKGVQTPITRSY